MTPRKLAIILYEDQLSGPIRGFGPHKLLVRCVLDALEISDPAEVGAYFADKVVEGRAMKGNGKVIRVCELGADQVGPQGEHIIAVLDADRVREALGLGPAASDDAVAAAFARRVPRQDCKRFSLLLLSQNTESVVIAIGECDEGRALTPDLLRGAITDKVLDDRDRVCDVAAAPQRQRLRDCVKAKVPSFESLVKLVCSLVRREPVDGVCSYLAPSA